MIDKPLSSKAKNKHRTPEIIPGVQRFEEIFYEENEVGFIPMQTTLSVSVASLYPGFLKTVFNSVCIFYFIMIKWK